MIEELLSYFLRANDETRRNVNALIKEAICATIRFIVLKQLSRLCTLLGLFVLPSCSPFVYWSFRSIVFCPFALQQPTRPTQWLARVNNFNSAISIVLNMNLKVTHLTSRQEYLQTRRSLQITCSVQPSVISVSSLNTYRSSEHQLKLWIH